jgi:hypothetical protein
VGRNPYLSSSKASCNLADVNYCLQLEHQPFTLVNAGRQPPDSGRLGDGFARRRDGPCLALLVGTCFATMHKKRGHFRAVEARVIFGGRVRVYGWPHRTRSAARRSLGPNSVWSTVSDLRYGRQYRELRLSVVTLCAAQGPTKETQVTVPHKLSPSNWLSVPRRGPPPACRSSAATSYSLTSTEAVIPVALPSAGVSG